MEDPAWESVQEDMTRMAVGIKVRRYKFDTASFLSSVVFLFLQFRCPFFGLFRLCVGYSQNETKKIFGSV